MGWTPRNSNSPLGNIHSLIYSFNRCFSPEWRKMSRPGPNSQDFVLTGRDTQKQADMSTTKLAIILPNLLLLPSPPFQSTLTPIQSVSHTAARGTLLKHTSHPILNSKPPKSSHLHKMQTSPPGLLGQIISGPFLPLWTIPHRPNHSFLSSHTGPFAGPQVIKQFRPQGLCTCFFLCLKYLPQASAQLTSFS